MKKVEAAIVKTGMQSSIALFFKYDEQIVELIRPLRGAHWDPERKCWLIMEANGPLESLNLKFKNKLQFVSRGAVCKQAENVPEWATKINIPPEYSKTLLLKKYSKRTQIIQNDRYIPDDNHIVLNHRGCLFIVEQLNYRNHIVSIVKNDSEVEWIIA